MLFNDSVKETFQYAVEDLIKVICNETDEDSSQKLSRKVFYQVFRRAQSDIDSVIHDILAQIENSFSTYREEIASELADGFAGRFWYEFSDGHDIMPGVTMLCYFKNDNKYLIGISCESESGITFRFQDGSVSDPDFVADFPPVKNVDCVAT